MNCSNPDSKLDSLIKELYAELAQRFGNESKQQQQQHPTPKGDALYLVVLIMVMYAVLAGLLILAYTRSRKRESKHDPYHIYIERDWTQSKGMKNTDNEEQDEKGALVKEPLLGVSSTAPPKKQNLQVPVTGHLENKKRALEE